MYMTTVPTVSNANQALSLVGRLGDLVKKGVTIDLQEAIVHLREAVLALKEENLNLKEQNTSLQKTLDKRESLKFQAPNYYLIDGAGLKDGPFCQVCHDNQNKLIRLKVIEEGSWTCGVCNVRFENEQHKAARKAIFRTYNNS
jgi:hypothetical protein